ncbi:ABC transporter ATP-binding protein [Dysgonomonas sp. Marseille-P4677]|uniref:ABC transporter ATP-binding protein n=1 Tax=Dysgonomonas sp. Marseille-P4677 TaxID=2364790 RepID=UPI0019149A96|nr:ABC transporter ATP-binding protein [Dysgonomonas sp. Marseille-P4677]MBK5721642.1 ABC transporter ATP-binding protein [Dysgonomonas sp. Marseille-P4677]
MSEIAIKFENISKQYRLGVVGTGTIKDDINRWWHTVRGKEDPYLKIGEVNDRSAKANGKYVWALKDITFDVKQGDVVGIIGRNGAGKSTLLKLLSRVTTPSTGYIKAKGRIASLLEVGTGFHPELTGRENIYMNGSIMGMTKAEINRKLDEIIAFAGVEKYIDTPSKRYSSGMTVRLGFAIAAHLEPEILVVDEVLAVGDAEFQKKAIGKMQDVSTSEGRTVLFVSHNMGAVKSLCNSGILLKNGMIDYMGNINDTLDHYLSLNTIKEEESEKIEFSTNRSGTGEVIFADFYIESNSGIKIDTIATGEDVFLVFVLKANKSNIKNIDLGFSFHDQYDDNLTNLYSSYQNKTFSLKKENEYHTIKCKISNFSLTTNKITVRGLIRSNGEILDWPQDILGSMYIEYGDYYKTGQSRSDNFNAKYLIKGTWVD